jgi:serine acetyltransferase
MGSVVTHDIPPYEIWAGNPARFIRKRFDDKTIEKLSKLQWWDWDDEKLQQEARHFNNVEAFILREDSNEWT